MQAAPAAIHANITLLAGIWAVPDDTYEAEKAAFLSAVLTYGTSYLAAVSVGSESLYRKEIDPILLASRINDIRCKFLFAFVLICPAHLGTANVLVGSTDTWTSWVDPVNDPVLLGSLHSH